MLSLDSIPYDAEFEEGARNAIETCLGVRPGERLTLITDLATCEIAASLLAAARRRGAQVECFVLEDEAPRPLSHCPPSILRGVANSTVVVGCFHPQEGEILSRRELIDLVERKRIKYAHMIWMSPSIMCQSMRADYYAVDALSNRVLSCVRGRRKVVVHSPAGTDIEVTLHRDHLWIKTSGLISPMYWSNLPGGEVWCAPEEVNGVFVVDGTVGDYLCPKYGDISATPLTLEIEENRLRSAHCRNSSLLSDFLEYCGREENGNRIGEFAFGTNIGISQMIGNLLQDEKVPGVHIAFGNPLPNLTGARWTCTTHIDAIARNVDAWADGVQILSAGEFLI